MRVRRIFQKAPILAIACVSAAGLLVGCGTYNSPTEPVISGAIGATTKAELQADLQSLSSIKILKDAFETKMKNDKAQGAAAVDTDVKVGNGYGFEFTAYALNRRYFNDLIAKLAKSENVAPAKLTADITKQTTDSFPGGKEALDKLPTKMRTEQLLTFQYIEALISSHVKPKEYFDSHQKQFARGCVKHILVADEATAKKTLERIRKGEDFGKLAKELSTDPGSGSLGGDLGCGSLDQYVDEFKNAAAKAKKGVVTEPVKSQFGYHLILLGDEQPAKYSPELEKQIVSQLSSQAIPQVIEGLKSLAKKSNTVVNPKFGVYKADAEPFPQIVAQNPKSTSNSNSTPTTTAAG